MSLAALVDLVSATASIDKVQSSPYTTGRAVHVTHDADKSHSKTGSKARTSASAATPAASAYGTRLHIRLETPDNSTWVALLVAKLLAAPNLASTPWRQSVHRYYTTPRGVPVHTATSHDPHTGGITVIHSTASFVAVSGKGGIVSDASASVGAPGRASRAATGTGTGTGTQTHTDTDTGPQEAVDKRISATWLSQHRVRLQWGTPTGPMFATVTGRTEVPVAVRELQDRADSVRQTCILQSCTFAMKSPGPTDVHWNVEVGLMWTHATTTGALLAMKEGASPLYVVLLTGSNVGAAVQARGVQYVTLDAIMKLGEVMGIQLAPSVAPSMAPSVAPTPPPENTVRAQAHTLCSEGMPRVVLPDISPGPWTLSPFSGLVYSLQAPSPPLASTGPGISVAVSS
jgi:hypothetical protein